MRRKQFQISVKGNALNPETMPIGELGSLLLSYENAVIATAEAKGRTIEGKAVLGLVEISDGSARLSLSVRSDAESSLRDVSRAVALKQNKELPYKAQEALSKISNQAARCKWEIDFPGYSLGRAVIADWKPFPPPFIPTVSGNTTIYGECIRVGGATSSRADVRLLNGKLIHVDLSQELAKVLGQRLYEEVCLVGEAVWNSDTWEMCSFTAEQITNYQQTDILKAFDQLANAAGDRWDTIDADRFVRDSRESIGG